MANNAQETAERLTTQAHFGAHGDGKLLAVCAGVEVWQAESLTNIILEHVENRMTDAVGSGEPIEGDEAFLLGLLIDMAKALRTAAGSAA